MTHSLWELSRNKLALHKLTYGVAPMRKLIKYTNQGFTACAGTMQSILEATVKEPDELHQKLNTYNFLITKGTYKIVRSSAMAEDF